jgi:hypothetical protein
MNGSLQLCEYQGDGGRVQMLAQLAPVVVYLAETCGLTTTLFSAAPAIKSRPIKFDGPRLHD